MTCNSLCMYFTQLLPQIISDLFCQTVNYKQELHQVFVISRIIKVEANVISWGQRLRLITLAETLIIPNITKTEFNYCFIIVLLWKIYKNYYKHKSQVNFQLKLNLNSLNDYPKQLVHYCFDMTFGGEYPCFTVFKPRNLCLVWINISQELEFSVRRSYFICRSL